MEKKELGNVKIKYNNNNNNNKEDKAVKNFLNK